MGTPITVLTYRNLGYCTNKVVAILATTKSGGTACERPVKTLGLAGRFFVYFLAIIDYLPKLFLEGFNMKHNKLIGTLILAASSLLLAACGNSQASSTNKTLNITIPGRAMTTDPDKTLDTNSDLIQNQIYEGLYAKSATGKIIPGVATKIVKPTNNGKTYTFTLRKDAKWSNGDTVTAQDFVLSLRRHLDPKTKSQNTDSLKSIKNYEGVYSGKMATSKLGVKAISKYKLQIELSQRSSWFDYLLTEIYPLSTNAIAKYGSKYGTSSDKTVSNGAYKLADWNVSKDSWSYTKNSQYWDAKDTKISKIDARVVSDPNTAQNLFKSDEVQETQVSGQFVKEDAKLKSLHITPQNRLNYLMFNAKNKTLNNPNLARAVSNALDRSAITDKVLQDGSVAAQSEIIKDQYQDPRTGKDYYGNHKLQTYDLAKAKKYWNTFKKETGKSTLTMELLTDDTDSDKKAGQYIQGQLEKYLPGIKISITSIPHAQHVSRDFSGKFEMNLTGYSTEYPDPTDMMNLATKGNTINFTQWTDSKYETLMAKANNLGKYTDKERANYIQQADERLMAIQGTIPLYQPATANLLSTKIGGIHYGMLNAVQYKYAYWK